MSKTLGAAMKKAAEKKVAEATSVELVLVRETANFWRYELPPQSGERFPRVVIYSDSNLGPRAIMNLRAK